jgi:hypothetical protein
LGLPRGIRHPCRLLVIKAAQSPETVDSEGSAECCELTLHSHYTRHSRLDVAPFLSTLRCIKVTKRTEAERFGNSVLIRFVEISDVYDGDGRAFSIEQDPLLRDDERIL